jgi:energy-coupling factor transporter ATP-binding protein EcfA2
MNPFPGLRPFEPDEDHLFFGREKQIDEVLRKLRTNRFLLVTGTSGSGKSSLLRSGLIPSLYSGLMANTGSNWRSP